MKLNELLKFNDIVIQCHDNPDADALASGFALYWYFIQNDKKPVFIYCGKNRIHKSNLMIMLDELSIPITYVEKMDRRPELLVTVDCQYGQKNVTAGEADNIAIIDHHQPTVNAPELCEIRSNIGSCSTIIWDMIRAEGYDLFNEKNVSTALYYGLYTDTNRFSEISHPLDRDMMDSLNINKSLVTEMSNSNISLDELMITGRAILGYDYYEQYKYLIIHAEKCDPNILGVISDFSTETEGVDVCLAYYESPEEIKFSVRSCTKEVHANEVAVHLSDGVGGGGGHIRKAGGSIRPEKLVESKEYNPSIDESIRVKEFFKARLDEYLQRYEILYAKNTTLDTSTMKLYEKLPQELGYVKLTDVFPVNSMLEIRTLEGDINMRLNEDKYLMIGIEGEIYPINVEKLNTSYKPTGRPFTRTFEYEPSVTDVFTGEKKSVMAYAKGIISTGKSRIYAKPLDHYIKLFTSWDEEKYYAGEPGDYIAVRDDDPHDIYIINSRFFDRLYKEV